MTDRAQPTPRDSHSLDDERAIRGPVEQFQAVDRRYHTLVDQWNALLTAEARTASGLNNSLKGAGADRRAAAAVLLHDAAGRHRIEQKPGVFLVLGPGGHWQIDPGTTDDELLDGYDGGALNEACEHDPHDLDAECQAVTAAADGVALPTVGELTALLLNHLYQDHRHWFGRQALDTLSDQALDNLSTHLDATRQRRASAPADDRSQNLPGGHR